MKAYLRVLCVNLTGLCFFAVSSLAVPEKVAVDQWIKDLGSETFEVREKASQELWKSGEAAMPALRDAVMSNDPEVAMRAREAISKVELKITRDTPVGILSLIEAYKKSSSGQKLGVLNSLKEERAYFQMLKLFSMENPEEQKELASAVEDVAMFAAREAIVANQVDQAVELLRMAPSNHDELMALACLFRSLGQLDQQIANPDPPQNVDREMWKGYLLRANGDLDGAIELAGQTKQLQLLAGLKVLKGDPVPWLELNQAPGHRKQNPQHAQQAYVDIALKRWRGEEVDKNDFDPLVKSLTANSRMQRNLAMSSLASLGQLSMVEKSRNKENPSMAYLYYLSREEISKALEILGLDPVKPDYEKWVKAQFVRIEEGDYPDSIVLNLVLMAAFMEKRGLDQELDKAFGQPLTDLQKSNQEVYWEVISRLFMGEIGAPHFTIQHLAKWAGEDVERWGEVFSSALGEEGIVMEWLDWIREIDPEMKDREALEAMMAIFKMSGSPGKSRETWMNRIWKIVQDEKNKDLKMQYAKRIMTLCIQQQDVRNTLKAWDMLDQEQKESNQWGSIDIYLTAAGRWEEAAKILLDFTGEKTHASPEVHAHLAATLRRAGMEREARKHDEMAEKLCLGSAASSMRIAAYYVYGGDKRRADIWFQRAVLEADPADGDFLTALEKCAEKHVRDRNWRLAASCHEVVVHIQACEPYRENSLPEFAKSRMYADLSRAMSTLPENKERALQTLKSIHEDFMTDGVLADDFFPALREAGLNRELEAWFADTWRFMVEVIGKYPKSHNSRNTAAWFASRAGIKLAEAEKYLAEAIDMSPEQAAYLDTMAELKFAQGDRKAALKWSTQSLGFAPFEDAIRSQHERFLTAPFRKN
jgi:hypothetical protein